jgi:hypothetical protein
MGFFENMAAKSEMRTRELMLGWMREVSPDIPTGNVLLPCHIIDEVHNGFYVDHGVSAIGFYRCQDFWWGRALTPKELDRLRSPAPESVMKKLQESSPQCMGAVSDSQMVAVSLASFYDATNAENQGESVEDADFEDDFSFLDFDFEDDADFDVNASGTLSEQEFSKLLFATQGLLNESGISIQLLGRSSKWNFVSSFRAFPSGIESHFDFDGEKGEWAMDVPSANVDFETPHRFEYFPQSLAVMVTHLSLKAILTLSKTGETFQLNEQVLTEVIAPSIKFLGEIAALEILGNVSVRAQEALADISSLSE